MRRGGEGRKHCRSVHRVCGNIPIVVSGSTSRNRDHRQRAKKNVRVFRKIITAARSIPGSRYQWRGNIFSVHAVDAVSGRNLENPLVDACKALLDDDGLQLRRVVSA